MTEKELFFKNLLIDFHTSRIKSHNNRVGAILENIGRYSYAHTSEDISNNPCKLEKAYKALVERHKQIMDENF